jgi:hypothetical protein
MFDYKILAVVAIVLMISLLYMNVRERFGTISPYPTRYRTLGNQYGNPLFSPCINKRCAGGPYMYTNNPYLQAACKTLTGHDLAQTACGKAFHGKPIHFEYSTLSNGAWSNTLCNTITPGALCAL